MQLVTLYDSEECAQAIGVVEYTDNLDHWDGRNWSCGSMGRHLGIGRTVDGRWYVVKGTQWQGERDYAYLIEEDEAKQLVLVHRPDLYEELIGEKPPILSKSSEKKERS